MRHSFILTFNPEKDTIQPKIVCASCREKISNIHDGFLAAPIEADDEFVEDDQPTWSKGVLLHMRCLDTYEEAEGVHLGSFPLVDALPWMCFNTLEEATVHDIDSFLENLKELTRWVEELRGNRERDPNHGGPWKD